MPKPIKPRHQNVTISDHAWHDRWMERAGFKIKRKKLQAILQAKLTNDAQGTGIYLDKTGAGWVEIFPWLWATVRITDRGWLVMTFEVWDGSYKREEAAG